MVLYFIFVKKKFYFSTYSTNVIFPQFTILLPAASPAGLAAGSSIGLTND